MDTSLISENLGKRNPISKSSRLLNSAKVSAATKNTSSEIRLAFVKTHACPMAGKM